MIKERYFKPIYCVFLCRFIVSLVNWYLKVSYEWFQKQNLRVGRSVNFYDRWLLAWLVGNIVICAGMIRLQLDKHRRKHICAMIKVNQIIIFIEIKFQIFIANLMRGIMLPGSAFVYLLMIWKHLKLGFHSGYYLFQFELSFYKKSS